MPQGEDFLSIEDNQGVKHLIAIMCIESITKIEVNAAALEEELPYFLVSTISGKTFDVSKESPDYAYLMEGFEEEG